MATYPFGKCSLESYHGAFRLDQYSHKKLMFLREKLGFEHYTSKRLLACCSWCGQRKFRPATLLGLVMIITVRPFNNLRIDLASFAGLLTPA
jgi:hypothetical protein